MSQIEHMNKINKNKLNSYLENSMKGLKAELHVCLEHNHKKDPHVSQLLYYVYDETDRSYCRFNKSAFQDILSNDEKVNLENWQKAVDFHNERRENFHELMKHKKENTIAYQIFDSKYIKYGYDKTILTKEIQHG